MGFWKKLGQGWAIARQVAPLLPLPNKAQIVISKAGEVETDVKAIVDEVKPKKKPTRPAA